MLAYVSEYIAVNVLSGPIVLPGQSPMSLIVLFRRCAVSITAVLLATQLVAAQAPKPSSTPSAKWWNSEQYKRELGLTQEQSRRLEEIFQAALPHLRAHKATLDTAEAELSRMVERADDRTVMEQVTRVETARAELSKMRTMMLLRMRKLLTTDQWAKLTALQAAAHEKRTAKP